MTTPFILIITPSPLCIEPILTLILHVATVLQPIAILVGGRPTAWDGLTDRLLDIDLSGCIIQDNLDKRWSQVRDSILEACHLFIPSVKSKKSYCPKWYTLHIIYLINKIKSL